MATNDVAALLREVAKLTKAVEDVVKELREMRREAATRGR